MNIFFHCVQRAFSFNTWLSLIRTPNIGRHVSAYCWYVVNIEKKWSQRSCIICRRFFLLELAVFQALALLNLLNENAVK